MTVPTTPQRRLVHVVPHTHWDREWYEPFQRFRLRLVDLLDEVLPRLAADPELRFTLDGQTAAVDDYLEIRPEAFDQVRDLVRRGQLAVGPWRVLADSFLCSGENLVRNLEIGLARAAELGGAMPVAYLPDQFGHAAQLPQVLRGFGFRQACLWRGVPSIVDSNGFAWVAPDGSAVRTEYLPGGYGNAAVLFSDRDATQGRAEDFAERMTAWFGADEVLAMYGADHGGPLPSLTEQVRAVSAADSPVMLRLATLTEALADRDLSAELLEVHGELRSHARANLLPGVLSVRAPVKQAMAAAERMVQRYAEPLAALWFPAAARPFAEMAWQRLVDASCHDSVTGCGADSTAAQVAGRIAEAEQLGSAVRDRVVDALAARVPGDAVLVLNPSPWPRQDLVRCSPVAEEAWAAVEFELPDGRRVPAQEVDRPERVLVSAEFPAAEIAEAVRRRTFGQVMYDRAVRQAVIGAGVVEFSVGRLGNPAYDLERFATELAARSGEHPVWELRVVDEPRRELLAVIPVPPLGWTGIRAVEATASADAPVSLVDGVLSNGLVSVSVLDDGTLRITGADGSLLDGVGRICDGGDAGDSYNYGPPVADLLVHEPVAILVCPDAPGPLLGGYTVYRTYEWPIGLHDAAGSARAAKAAATEVSMAVELRAGEPFVRVEIRFENRSRDHRVRWHLPVGEVAGSRAEGQFGVVARGLRNEGGNGEAPLPTFPASGFVAAGQATVLLEQATEYEITGGELALTLLRSVGAISRNLHPLRAEPAGPTTPIPGAQELGWRTARFGIAVGARSVAETMDLVERFTLPLVSAPGTGEPGHLGDAVGLAVEGAVVSGVREREGELEVRLVAYSDKPVPTVLRWPGLATARVTDLAGNVVGKLDVVADSVELVLRGWEIATIRLGQGLPQRVIMPPS